MQQEVERKFYFHPKLWPSKPQKTSAVEQGYLASTGDWEIRLRRSGRELKYTMKSGGGLARQEWEVSVPPSEFEALWPSTEGRRIVKLRERHSWSGNALEVDTYGGALEGLTIVEVEFQDKAKARAFSPPPAFGPELTYDRRFKNRALAENPAAPHQGPGSGALDWSYGVIPFRKAASGWELIMVSTRRHDRWIFPKGQPEPGMTAEEVAILEAKEEAGLTGRVAGHPLVLPYVRETGTTNLLLFPFLVSAMAGRWLESGERERRSVTAEEAASLGELGTLGAQWLADLHE